MFLTTLIRFCDVNARTSMAQKEFDPEELDNEVDPPSTNPTITEERALKLFDSQELYNEVGSPSNYGRRGTETI